MDYPLGQNNSSYQPIILEEHSIGNGPDHKLMNMIVIAGVILFAGVVAWYVISKKQPPQLTPGETLNALADSSMPITKSATEIYAQGQVLGSLSAPTITTPQQRLQILNNFNQ